MALQFSAAARNAMLDSLETTIGASPTIELYSGAPPANCAAADSGTLIASIALPADYAAAASAGSKAGSGLPWTDASANNAGTIGHYRFKSSGGTVHEQGTVGETATAWAISTAYTLNQRRAANSNVYICATAGTSAASGAGPIGTGVGITDGTAVWNYLCVQTGDMTVDNCVVTAGQQVSITAKTQTAPGA